jgi:hypothetical protein
MPSNVRLSSTRRPVPPALTAGEQHFGDAGRGEDADVPGSVCA